MTQSDGKAPKESNKKPGDAPVKKVGAPPKHPVLVDEPEITKTEMVRPSQSARFADLFERLWDNAFIIEFEAFKILDVNDACERTLGIASAQLIGADFLSLVHPEDQEYCRKSLRIARRRYYPRRFECRYRLRPDSDEVTTVEIAACVLKLEDESEVIQIIASDKTEIKKAEAREAKYLEELEEMNKKLEALSITDEMTGLSNFRHFKTEAEKEHERSKRYDTVYTIIFCDVDNFKHYNDRNGHPAGDRVLQGVSKILTEQCRSTDLPARYGGEEFVILAPGVDARGANVLAERIRKDIQGYPFDHSKAQPLGFVSISIGVASFPEDGESLQEILNHADQALYVAKESGRNLVISYGDLTEEQISSQKKAG